MKNIGYNLDLICDKPGIYTWYIIPRITKFDIERLKKDLLNISGKERIKKIDFFMYEYFIKYFKNESYNATISGKLMPTFVGQLFQQYKSERYLEFIDNDLSVLLRLDEFLKSVPTIFLNPVYIGKADSLRCRIGSHIRMLKRYSERSTLYESIETESEKNEEIIEARNFAERIVSRGINLSFLYFNFIETDGNLFLENILNRINYPILGRN